MRFTTFLRNLGFNWGLLGGWLGKVDIIFESKQAYIYFMFLAVSTESFYFWGLLFLWVLTNVAKSFSLFFFGGFDGNGNNGR